MTSISTGSASIADLHQLIDQNEVDPCITYPCYKSFDEFIDLERLKSLDSYLTKKIRNHIDAKNEDFFLSAFRLDQNAPHQPGAREIWLTLPKSKYVYCYDDLENIENWELSAYAESFPLLMDFIDTLPFKSKSRILIIYDDKPRAVPSHRDHLNADICHEFIWFRTNLKKPFYMLNHKNGEKRYVEGYSAWFDSVNQFHGVDACEGFSFSFRIDGLFTDEFKKRIPVPKFNRASIPALWACAPE